MLTLGAIVAGLTAGVVLGFTGFGFNLLAVPLLALAFPVREAIGMALVAGIIANGLLTLQHRRLVRIDIITPVVGGSAVGLAAGVLTSHLLPEMWLRLAVGVMTLGIAVHIMVRSQTRTVVLGGAQASGLGAISGVLTAATGMGGPPIVAYLTHALEHASHIRASLAFYTASISLAAALGLFATSAISVDAVVQGIAMAPACVIGMLCGSVLFRWLPHLYTKAVGSTLLIAVFAGAAVTFTTGTA